MHDVEFRRLLQEQPDSATNKLVYADYLEELGDTKKAELLRLEVRLQELAEQLANRSKNNRVRRREAVVEEKQVKQRLQELRLEIHPDWLAELNRGPVENCGRPRNQRVDFEFECPKRWETLEETSSPVIRHCDQCQQQVYFCLSEEEAIAHARQDRCVAIDCHTKYNPLALDQRRRIRMGKFRPNFDKLKFAAGDKVRIVSGGFSGWVAKFVRYQLPHRRALVSVEHFDREMRLEVVGTNLEKCEES